jgi:hypothetical protein
MQRQLNRRNVTLLLLTRCAIDRRDVVFAKGVQSEAYIDRKSNSLSARRVADVISVLILLNLEDLA